VGDNSPVEIQRINSCAYTCFYRKRNLNSVVIRYFSAICYSYSYEHKEFLANKNSYIRLLSKIVFKMKMAIRRQYVWEN